MSEPLDLEPIKKRRFSQYAAVDDRLALLAEVERLRGEVARQAEQITAVRTLVPSLPGCGYHDCGLDTDRMILAALDGAS